MAAKDGTARSNGCTCFIAEIPYRLDPRMREADGKRQLLPEDIARCVAANLAAFGTATEICGIPVQ